MIPADFFQLAGILGKNESRADQQAVIDRAERLRNRELRENWRRTYKTSVKNGKLVLVAHGMPEDVERARKILDQTQAESTTVHDEQVAVDV